MFEVFVISSIVLLAFLNLFWFRLFSNTFLEQGKIIEGKLERANPFDAGQDIFSATSVYIPARSSCLISTGLKIEIPKGCVGLVWSRSGNSVKRKLEVGAGCIDAGYQGEILVHLYNHSDVDVLLPMGEKIAQLLTIPINTNNYRKARIFSEKSKRGSKGFGSSD